MSQIITVAHQKGGVGKSTLSFNLAHVFKNGLRIGICDTDLQGSLTKLDLQDDGLELIELPDKLIDLKQFPQEIIIIDTPPYLLNKLPELFSISDFVLIPTKAGFLDFMAIKTTIAILKESVTKNSHLQAGIVFNMIKQSSTIEQEIKSLFSDIELPILNTVITDRVSYTRSIITKGILNSNDEKAKLEMVSLADEILNKMGV